MSHPRTTTNAMNQAARMIVGRRVQNRRLAKGLTQAALAKRCGWVNRQQVAQIESGESGFNVGTAYVVAAALDTEAWDLMPPLSWVLHHARETVELTEDGLRVR